MIIHYEDEHLIVVQKPSKVPCQSDPTGDMDLCTMLENIIQDKQNKTNSKLFVVHRLDRPVGGLIVYAKNQNTAQQLSKLIQERAFNKIYLCITCGETTNTEGHLIHHLKKKAGQNMSLAVHKNNEGAKEARLSYIVLDSLKIKRDTLSLMEVNLETGRHHQIRVQFSASGLPLWGDTKYNPAAKRNRNWTQIALWSHKLSFVHPVTLKQLEFIDWPEKVEPWSLFEYTS